MSSAPTTSSAIGPCPRRARRAPRAPPGLDGAVRRAPRRRPRRRRPTTAPPRRHQARAAEELALQAGKRVVRRLEPSAVIPARKARSMPNSMRLAARGHAAPVVVHAQRRALVRISTGRCRQRGRAPWPSGRAQPLGHVGVVVELGAEAVHVDADVAPSSRRPADDAQPAEARGPRTLLLGEQLVAAQLVARRSTRAARGRRSGRRGSGRAYIVGAAQQTAAGRRTARRREGREVFPRPRAPGVTRPRRATHPHIPRGKGRAVRAARRSSPPSSSSRARARQRRQGGDGRHPLRAHHARHHRPTDRHPMLAADRLNLARMLAGVIESVVDYVESHGKYLLHACFLNLVSITPSSPTSSQAALRPARQHLQVPAGRRRVRPTAA